MPWIRTWTWHGQKRWMQDPVPLRSFGAIRGIASSRFVNAYEQLVGLSSRP